MRVFMKPWVKIPASHTDRCTRSKTLNPLSHTSDGHLFHAYVQFLALNGADDTQDEIFDNLTFEEFVSSLCFSEPAPKILICWWPERTSNA